MKVTTGGVTVTAGGLMVNGAKGSGSGKGLTITAGNLVTNDLYIDQQTIHYSGSYSTTSDKRLKTRKHLMQRTAWRESRHCEGVFLLGQSRWPSSL